MSIESLAVCALVQEGKDGIAKMLQDGVSAEDFSMYDEEVEWIQSRAVERRPISVRSFRAKFPDFEFLKPEEGLKDLLQELKRERVFTDLRALLDSMYDELEPDRAIEQADFLRDKLGDITRQHSPISDFALISDYKTHLKEIGRLRALRATGATPGVPSGLKHIDFHWDGFVRGRFIVVLGRPGSAKSYSLAYYAWTAVKHKLNVMFVSPEMNQFEHRCRIHTLASADPQVKKALGIEHSFRNRALMNGIGFNKKKYERFLEYLAEECGEIYMPTGTHRRAKMTPQFLEAKIYDMQPDIIFIDPIYKLSAGRSRASRIEEISDISDQVQDLAETYNVPIIITNQAHRQMTRKDDAPHMDTSFNSDVPVQEADHVIGVKHVADEHKMLFRCTKSRFGQDFRFDARFIPNTGVLTEMDEPTGSYYGDDDDAEDDADIRKIMEEATVKGRGEKNGD